MNYLDIVVDASLSLTDSPENIQLKLEDPGTKVKKEKKDYLLWSHKYCILYMAISQMLYLCPQVRLTVFPKRKVEYFTKVAWWIIFLTVLAGLLLVAALGFLLWKVTNQIC